MSLIDKEKTNPCFTFTGGFPGWLSAPDLHMDVCIFISMHLRYIMITFVVERRSQYLTHPNSCFVPCPSYTSLLLPTGWCPSHLQKLHFHFFLQSFFIPFPFPPLSLHLLFLFEKDLPKSYYLLICSLFILYVI